MVIHPPLNYDTENDTFGVPITNKESKISMVMNNRGYDRFYLNLMKKSQPLQHGNESQQFMLVHQSQSQSFDAFQDKQKREFDQFILSPNERLRFLLEEQRKQMIRRIEEKASAELAKKDQEIMKAFDRRTELVTLLQKMDLENQTWQGLAKQREARVTSLNSRLNEERERARLTAASKAADEGSFCGGGGGGDDGGGSKKTTPCRGCGYSDSCVLFLPCRHLCCCRDCVPFLILVPFVVLPRKVVSRS